MSTEFPDVAVDTTGSKYELDRLLGHGGQGAVFAVRGRDLAVKFSTVLNHAKLQRFREKGWSWA